MRTFLRKSSTLEYPPAICAIEGLGSDTFLLYRCIVLDRLHAFDLGPSRDLCDYARILFSNADYNKNNVMKALLVRITNLRIRELPIFGQVKISPFRSSYYDVQSRMTAPLRRILLPFLWVALMGLQPQTRPDGDTSPKRVNDEPSTISIEII